MLTGSVQPNAGGDSFYTCLFPNAANAATPDGTFHFPQGWWGASVGSKPTWRPNPYPQPTLDVILLPPGQTFDGVHQNGVFFHTATGAPPTGILSLAFTGDLDASVGTSYDLDGEWQQTNVGGAMDSLVLVSGKLTRTY
jgi:hypothetical protein